MITAMEAQQPPSDFAEVDGMIVSVRGNIVQIRPGLRPKMVRASISDKTEISGMKRNDKILLKEGMYFTGGGMFSEKDGVSFFWIASGASRIGALKQSRNGLVRNGAFVSCGGKIKSLEPFTFTDDNGKEFKGKLDKVQGKWEVYPADRNSLLIGVRVNLFGKVSPDGVIQAQSISPNKDYSASGTMFGEIRAVDGDKVTIRPRYTKDDLIITLKQTATLQEEEKLDPESFKVGDNVTFWGQKSKAKDGLNALALLLGEGRYPEAKDEYAPIYLTGNIASISPNVVLTTPDGVKHTIQVPAQMPFARLKSIEASHLKKGVQAMFVLERDPDSDGFITKAIIVNASPWVGYGG